MDTPIIDYELQQLANEAKLRGVEFFNLSCEDWRDIPTSVEEIHRLPDDKKEYWMHVATALVLR